MSDTFDDWGSDVPPSTPSARPSDYRIAMGGFCFTDGGISVDVSEAEAEALRHPPIGPSTMRGDS
jgi:hypothetical protein